MILEHVNDQHLKRINLITLFPELKGLSLIFQ